MDPVSKHLSAWKLIAKFTKSEGNSVVLATHHMDEVEALADDLVILHNGRSVIESISVEEMKKRLQGGSRSEPSLEDAFFNFIASEKAKEEQEEEEDDNIVVSLEEVDSAASEHNEDATEERRRK